MKDSFNSRSTLQIGSKEYSFHRLDAVEKAGLGGLARLPVSIRILLENLLRNEDGNAVSADDIRALASWDSSKKSNQEIAFTPARVILQDFTGVPAVVDLAAMRDAIHKLGGDPTKINPLQQVDLVIDHSKSINRDPN